MAFDFRPMIQILESEFGREHVHPRVYGAKHFEGGNIARDFCASAGLRWDERFTLPGVVNEAVSLDYIEALRHLSKTLSFFLKPERTRNSLYEYRIPIKEEERGTHLLNRKQRLALLERYEDSNRWIAQRYFGRDRLFDEPGECRVYRSSPLSVGALMVSMSARAILRKMHSMISGR